MGVENSITLFRVQQPGISEGIAYEKAIPSSIIGMNVKEARRRRLEKLQKEFGTLKNLAHEVNPKAKYLDRYLSQVLNSTRGMGDKVARRIEVALAKPEGWMDRLGVSSQDADELLKIWNEFPEEEQTRLLRELRYRLRALHEDRFIKQELGDPAKRPPKPTT